MVKIFDDVLQIWSPGFLPFGVTLEELYLPTHASKPRNRLITQVFYDMGMIEQYGSGIGRIIDECREAGLKKPEFGDFSGGFRVLFKSDIQSTPHDAHHDISEVSERVMVLLNAIDGEMGRDTLLGILRLKDRKNFRESYLKPAIDAGLIEMSRPDALQSKRQKYRLTAKGKALLKGE